MSLKKKILNNETASVFKFLLYSGQKDLTHIFGK